MVLDKVLLVTACAALVSGCTGISYGDRHLPPVDQAAMNADSARIQQSERTERAELRKERREEMMDAADAIRRARGDVAPVYVAPVYLIR